MSTEAMNTTSSCLCGGIKLSFSVGKEEVVAKFLCHCTDDRKITGTMFASNLILKDRTVRLLAIPAASYTSSLPANVEPLSPPPPPPSSSSAASSTALPAAAEASAPTIKTYTKTANSQSTMTSHFCSNCGTTLYRTSSGFPGVVVIKMGTIDDWEFVNGGVVAGAGAENGNRDGHFHEKEGGHVAAAWLKPEVEQFAGKRVSWLRAVEGAQQEEGNYFF